LGEIQFMRGVIAISWKSETGRAYFSDVSKWTYIYVYT